MADLNRYTRPRTVPLSGTDVFRLATQAANQIDNNELHTTSDQHRTFLEGYHVGNVWHGALTHEDAMLSLNTLSAHTVDDENPTGRGCFPLDMCYRLDTNSVWLCIGNRGESLGDWVNLNGLSAAEVSDIIDGRFAADELENVIDGGAAADEYTDIVDGNPEI